MNERLSGKVAIVTGAERGIGKAAAIALAREGAKVIVSGVLNDEGLAVAQAIEKNGGTAIFGHCDVAQANQVEALVARAVAEWGGLDIFVANAGIAFSKAIVETTEAEYDRMMNINLKGVFFCAKYAIPALKTRGGGSFIATASKVGLVAQRDSPVYCATKGGVVMLTKALALDYAASNIRVNSICPGIVDTPLLRQYIDSTPDPVATEAELKVAQPLGRLATPEECAGAIVFLASEEASFITGVALPIDGGFTAQ